MRRGHAFLLVVVLLTGVSSCRIFSREVACSRNGDCPRDAGMDFCDLPEDSDGGAGVCVAEDPNPPDDSDDDDDGGLPLFPDGGFPDAGA